MRLGPPIHVNALGSAPANDAIAPARSGTMSDARTTQTCTGGRREMARGTCGRGDDCEGGRLRDCERRAGEADRRVRQRVGPVGRVREEQRHVAVAHCRDERELRDEGIGRCDRDDTTARAFDHAVDDRRGSIAATDFVHDARVLAQPRAQIEGHRARNGFAAGTGRSRAAVQSSGPRPTHPRRRVSRTPLRARAVVTR